MGDEYFLYDHVPVIFGGEIHNCKQESLEGTKKLIKLLNLTKITFLKNWSYSKVKAIFFCKLFFWFDAVFCTLFEMLLF